MNRRHFLQTTLATTATIGFPAVVKSASPNSTLQVGAIGVGGMGGRTIQSVASHDKVRVTAICDVDSKYLAAASELFPDASQHRDWRAMLADAADQFDAVTIGTPDHMHAAPAVTALRGGKHVYLQKPMAPTLHECRVITQVAAEKGLVTQLGNQGRSSIESRMAVKMLQDGVIGKIKEVFIWENKPLSWWPKNTELRPEADAIPDGFDWDLWCGVREPVPYLEDTYHPKNWRAWFDFGTGELGDMGCHHFDPTFDALRLTAPQRVRQTLGGSSGPLWGEKRKVELEFPGTDMTAGDTVLVTWHDGGVEPDLTKVHLPKSLKEFPRSGCCWIGENGSIFKPYTVRPFAMPEEDHPPASYPRGFKPQDHYHDWVDAILEGRKACDDFSHGGPLTETVLVGTIADRFPGEWLDWDANSQKFSNSDEATALVRRAYRDGWKVEGLG